MATKRSLLKLWRKWKRNSACPATPGALNAMERVIKKSRNKPFGMGLSMAGGVILHWDKPMYKFKLRINMNGELDDVILNAINMMGDYSGGFHWFKKPPSFSVTEKELDEEKKDMLKEMEIWRQEDRFPATDEAVLAAERVLKVIRAIPQRIGIADRDGIMLRWDSPQYVCKLNINGKGDLKDNILAAIDTLPEDHSGIYGAGGEQSKKYE